MSREESSPSISPEFAPIAETVDTWVQEIFAAKVAPPKCASLPIIQQVAMLTMLDGRVFGDLKFELIGRLSEAVQDRPHVSDYATLIDAGYAERRDGARYHSLTVKGAISAAELVKHLCRHFNIHRQYEKGGNRFNIGYACTCGESFHVRKSSFYRGNAANAFNRHLTKVGYVAEEEGLAPELRPSLRERAPALVPDGVSETLRARSTAEGS